MVFEDFDFFFSRFFRLNFVLVFLLLDNLIAEEFIFAEFGIVFDMKF